MNGAHPSDNDSGSASSKKPEKPLRFVTNYGAPHPKRRRIGAACLTCRKRKTACSGERPFCDTCKQNKLDCAGYSNEATTGSSSTNTSKRAESDQSRPANESRQPTSKANDRGTHDGQSNSRTSSTQHTSSTSDLSNQIGGELSPGVKVGEDANVPAIPATVPEQPLFAGPRNRMPYFRWLGPTAIMPGFKQMVVKVKRQESELKMDL
ncbi:9257_t:CDS:1, partial [Scutellospora calospora]